MRRNPWSTGGFVLKRVRDDGALGLQSAPKRLQCGPGAVERVGQEMAVGAVNLLDGRAHEARKLEEADARRDGPRGERVAEGVGRPVLQTGRAEGGGPLPPPA